MPGIRETVREIQEAHRRLDEDDGLDDDGSAPPGEGCTEDEVAALERRLGVALPSSYRRFLLEVNGCGRLAISHGGLLPAAEVKWFREDNADWIGHYTHPSGYTIPEVSEEEHAVYGPGQESTVFRVAYLPETLQIGDVYDSSVYLLNPLVIDDAGEWEAWTFCSSYPGAHRVPSFDALVRGSLDELRREIRLRSLDFDQDAALWRAVAAVRRRADVEGISATEALERRLDEAAEGTDEFAALVRRPGAVRMLEDVITNLHLYDKPGPD